jgi:small-conductance mechanosensitive channel
MYLPGRIKSWFVVAVLALLSSIACSPLGAREAPNARARSTDNPAGSEQAARGASPGQPTAPNPITATHLAALPQPLPKSLTQGIDVAQRANVILEHLSEVIRFYRMVVTPIQKTGEPSDMLYAEQAQSTATQIAQLAFQSARDEAALLARIQVMPGQQGLKPAEGEAQRLRNEQHQVNQQIGDLQARAQALEKQIATARPKEKAALREQLDDVNGGLELAQAEAQALTKVSGVSGAQTSSGLEGDIDKLQQAVPEVIDGKVKPVANTIQSLGSLRDAGVITQGQNLFQLLATRRAIDERIAEVKTLHQQALDLRMPLVNILRATLQEGKTLEGNNGASSANAPSPDRAATRKIYDQLTDAFKTISGVSIPISQEMLLLEQAQGNLLTWRAAVDGERTSIVHSLLLRVVVIGIVLVLIGVLGEVWRRAVTKYVQDLRRRRQLLVIRRMVMGFATGLVLILGFISQFSSLATFAGFITAGLAVGLQTVLLSVAAYFFIVGRYGVRVGDRITIANVTGDVVEVGLVRFYVLELAGVGPVLHPTGRIAVFANSVLFQTGTPLYKQIPGTNYAWHEISVKLKAGSDYRPALEAIQRLVGHVYAGYKDQIERQHAEVEAWMDTSLPAPKVECRLEFTDGLRLTVLYPVLIDRAAAIDQQVVDSILQITGREPSLAQAMEGPPVLDAVVKA